MVPKNIGINPQKHWHLLLYHKSVLSIHSYFEVLQFLDVVKNSHSVLTFTRHYLIQYIMYLVIHQKAVPSKGIHVFFPSYATFGLSLGDRKELKLVG